MFSEETERVLEDAGYESRNFRPVNVRKLAGATVVIRETEFFEVSSYEE